MRINQPRSLILYTLAVVGVMAYGGMVSVHVRFGTLRAGHTPETLGWYGLAFLVYLAAVIWVERSGRYSWRMVWGAAVFFRVLLLFTQPTLSDDIYRYVWDGYVANQGVSPYAYAIDDPALDYLDIPERAQANNSWMASPYLPVAQLVFRTLTRFFPLKAIYFQIAAVLFDLMSAWIIGRLLALAQLPPRRLLLYLWNPLVIVETAHSAHIDAWMVLLTLLGFWLAWETRARDGAGRRLRDDVEVSPHRPAPTGVWGVFSPVFLALGTLTKILPVLLTPVLFWRWRWWQRLVFGAVTVGLLVPSGLRAGWGLSGPLDGRGLFGALRIYNDSWNFNSGLFHWLEVFLGNAGFEDANGWAKRIVLLAMLAVMLVVFVAARRYRSDLRGALRLSAVPLMAYVLLTTTVHPWYIHILLAFLPFLPGAFVVGDTESTKEQRVLSLWRSGILGWLAAAPWIYLSGALALSYLTYVDPNDYREFEWIRQTEWLPAWGMVGMAVVVWISIRVFGGKK
ncbi:MAG: hypothetical protein WAM60_18040 [Candidatus Promineifilaceae bacterium]